MSSRFLKFLLLMFVCLGSSCAAAQEMPAGRTLSGLQLLAGSAGIIFTGTVTSVQRIPASQDQLETMQITFRVAHALRGARAGRDLTIREWAGLWATGERYRVGEHELLFLYRPSNLGLTSPVAGRQGRFVMDNQERVIVPGGLLAEVTGARGGQGTLFDSGTAPERRGGTRVSYREVFRAVRRLGGE